VKGAEVLLVEDDADVRETITMLLEAEGFSVAAVVDGAAALARLRAPGEKPCVILLDLMMPRMNGWEFRAAQAADPALAAIPVVLLSASAQMDLLAADFAAAETLRKPVPLATLCAVVERYCGRRAP
jgi:CheY-like chemotaxis protein